MSSYYNKFKDGANDKPPKKKKGRTNHATWGQILRDITPGSKAAKKLGSRSGKSIKRQTQ